MSWLIASDHFDGPIPTMQDLFSSDGRCSCGCWYHGGDCIHRDTEDLRTNAEKVSDMLWGISDQRETSSPWIVFFPMVFNDPFADE